VKCEVCGELAYFDSLLKQTFFFRCFPPCRWGCGLESLCATDRKSR